MSELVSFEAFRHLFQQHAWETAEGDLLLAEVVREIQCDSCVLETLAVGLRDLAQKHIRYLREGFESGRFETTFRGGWEEPPVWDRDETELEIFTEGWVMEHVIARILYDRNIISIANTERSEGSESLLADLFRVDQLAQLALQLAENIDLLPAQGTGTFSYSKPDTDSPDPRFDIPYPIDTRVIPYADVSLIGFRIPQRSNLSKDEACTIGYLSIPHEVGHYVFWYKRETEDVSIAEQLTARSDPVYGWREEIFADVYCCLAGGPATALSAQDRIGGTACDSAFAEGIEGDSHPADILRPYIYTETLRHLSNRLAWPDLLPLAELLEAEWQGRLRTIGCGTVVNVNYSPIPLIELGLFGLHVQPDNSHTILFSPYETSPLPEDIKNVIERSLDLLMAETLADNLPPMWPTDDFLAALVDPDQGLELRELYTDFNERLGDVIAHITVPEGRTRDMLDPLYPHTFATVPIAEWFKVVQAEGWITKGPHSRM